MKIPAVFLLLVGLALARGDTAPDKVNQAETKNVHQVVKPSTLETASTNTGNFQITHMQHQPNRMDNQALTLQQHSQLQNAQSQIKNQASQFYNQASPVQDQELAQQYHSQNQASQFYNQASPVQDQELAQQYHSQNQASQIYNQASQVQDEELAQQYHSQNPVPFRNQGQSQIQRLNQRGQSATGSSVHSDQEISNLLQSSSVQSHPNEQLRDISGQQLYSGSIQAQEEFYRDRRDMVRDQLNGGRFEDSSNRQIISGLRSSEIRTGGIPQVFHSRSAFGSGPQPVILPGVSQTHSTSVVVSGLKNLPVLPALVYSAAPVPSTHAVAYSRPWFQGGAYVKQHWQTPFARYVYSHIL